MGRYIADQNKVVGIHESGTYAVPMTGSSFWIGQVTENTIDDSENLLIDRFLGTSTRNYDTVEQGPRDITGTLTYHVQNMRLPFWAIGSVYDISGTNSQHIVTEIATDSRLNPFVSGTGDLNPPMSFTLEDSKQAPGAGKNFIRTVKGATPNVVTITATQGEKVTAEVEYVGQTLEFTSGATTSVLEETNRPYLWSDCTLTLAGSTIKTAKEISFEINNNIEPPHYLNGSRDISTPILQEKDYTLNVTLDLEADDAKMLYETLYKNNGSFNAVFDLNADSSAGSQHAIFTLSGCRITAMDNPSTNEGLTESTIEIRPETVSAQEYASTLTSGIFNPY